MLTLCALAFRPDQCQVQSAGDARGDLVLQFEDICAIFVETIGPDVCAGFGVNELRIYSDLVSIAPHATLQDVAHIQLAADLFDVHRLPLEGKRSVAGDHETI